MEHLRKMGKAALEYYILFKYLGTPQKQANNLLLGLKVKIHCRCPCTQGCVSDRTRQFWWTQWVEQESLVQASTETRQVARKGRETADHPRGGPSYWMNHSPRHPFTTCKVAIWMWTTELIQSHTRWGSPRWYDDAEEASLIIWLNISFCGIQFEN